MHPPFPHAKVELSFWIEEFLKCPEAASLKVNERSKETAACKYLYTLFSTILAGIYRETVNIESDPIQRKHDSNHRYLTRLAKIFEFARNHIYEVQLRNDLTQMVIIIPMAATITDANEIREFLRTRLIGSMRFFSQREEEPSDSLDNRFHAQMERMENRPDQFTYFSVTFFTGAK